MRKLRNANGVSEEIIFDDGTKVDVSVSFGEPVEDERIMELIARECEDAAKRIAHVYQNHQ